MESLFVSIGSLIVLGLLVLLWFFSSEVARGVARFYSRYPLIRLAPNSQFYVRPFFVRLAAALVATAVIVSEFYR